KRSRRALTPATVAALLLALAPAAAAQETQSAPQTQPQPQTQSQPATPPAATTTSKTEAQVAAGLTREPAPAKAAEPLYHEYRGVTLGMSAADVRGKLGKPEEKSDEMDFFVFSDRERARVYYTDGKASAVIATYMGKDAAAPAPASVLGAEIEAKPDGSMYQMTPYPQAGYWVAYSRTAGDSPMVMITMQKSR
ncbi:MAG TPA: hypothetical protein VFZ44_00905, partial [Pyrinomonadaceae bacterium]